MSIQHRNILASLLLCLSLITYAQKIPEKSLNVLQMKSKGFSEAPKKVFIKNFKIYYQMIAEAEKTSHGGRQFGGGSYTGDATARLAVGVEGVASADLQQLTNEIYSDYLNKLKARGLEVYNSKDYPNMEFFVEDQLLEGPRINQEQIKGSLMVVPEDFSYYVKKLTKKGKEKGSFMSNVGGPLAQFNSAIYHTGLPNVSKELDDVIVVDISINVPSIYLDPKSRLGTVKIKGGAYLRLENARATYVSGKMKKPGAPSPDKAIEVTLTKAVPIPEVFGSQNFKTQASKQRTSVPDYAAFFTVQDTKVELSNTIKCEASVYQEEVGKVVKEFLDQSITKLGQGLNGEKVK
ncbi:MAG: hypothetical protein R8G66_06730 [Cytophagales bacterium]|nr:hypothetical protein [Cytophagales bacterium]